jgi:poly [ADP-ribose] polymerase
MRIAPPEAPCTGYNFGKGAYFADLSGKSNGYSRPYLSGGVGLFVVCEVALGKSQ